MTRHLDDDLAQGLVERSLDPETRRACEAHLRGCEACRLLVESYHALGDALDALPAPVPPAGFTAAVMARIEARERARAWDRRMALGIAGVALSLALALLGTAGAGAAPLLTAAGDALGRALAALSLGASVLSPVVRALRLQLAVACVALGLPLLLALWRLLPRAEADAVVDGP